MMTRSKRVSYVVHAADIQMQACGGRMVAVATRYGKRLVAFVPGPAQLAKIRKGRGEINVTEGAVSRARVFCSPYGR